MIRKQKAGFPNFSIPFSNKQESTVNDTNTKQNTKLSSGFIKTCNQTYNMYSPLIDDLTRRIETDPYAKTIMDTNPQVKSVYDDAMQMAVNIGLILGSKGNDKICSDIPKGIFNFEIYIKKYISQLQSVSLKIVNAYSSEQKMYLEKAIQSIKEQMIWYEEFFADFLSTIGVATPDMSNIKRLTKSLVVYANSFKFDKGKLIKYKYDTNNQNLFEVLDTIGFTTQSYNKLEDICSRLYTSITREKFFYGKEFKAYSEKFRYTNINVARNTSGVITNYDDFIGGGNKCSSNSFDVAKSMDIMKFINNVLDKANTKSFIDKYSFDITEITNSNRNLSVDSVLGGENTAFFFIGKEYNPAIKSIQIIVRLDDKHDMYIGGKRYLYKDVRQDLNNMIKPLLDQILYQTGVKQAFLNALADVIDFAQFKQSCSLQNGGKHVVQMRQSKTGKLLKVKKNEVIVYKKLGFKELTGGDEQSIQDKNVLTDEQRNEIISECCLCCCKILCCCCYIVAISS